MRRERVRELCVIAALASVVTLFFLDILLAGFNLYIRDFARTYYPERRIVSEILGRGEFPFWNPYVNGGQPLAANPAYSVFYPAQWLLPLGRFRATFHLIIVLHFPLAAAGMYLLMRSLRVRPSVAAFTGFSYALGGTMLSMTALVPFLYSMAWLPWIAWCVRRQRLIPASLALGVMLLIGEVSMILQTGGLIAAYAIRKRSVRPLGFALATIVLATLVGSVQIFPALEHQHDSARSHPLTFEQATTWSMRPVRVAEIVWPTLFSSASPDVIFQWGLIYLYPKEAWPWVINLYPGIVVALLVIAGFAVRVRGWLFVAIVAAIGFLFAIGRFGFAFPLLYHAGLKSLRYPEKFILMTMFILTLFAGIVAEEAIANLRVRRTLFIVAAIVTGITAIVVVITFLPAYPQWFARAWLLKAIDLDLASRFRNGMLLTLALAASVTLIARAQRLPLMLIALIAFVDLGIRVQGWAPRITADYYEPPQAARTLNGNARIYSSAEWQTLHAKPRPLPAGILPWMTRNGLFPAWETTYGFDGAVDTDVTSTNLLPSSDFSAVFHRLESQRLPLLLQMAGASHVGFLKDLDPSIVADPRRFDEIEPVRFAATNNAGPFYFAEAMFDSAEVLFSGATIPTRAAFVAMQPFAPAAGRVLSAKRTSNTVTLDVEAAGKSFLVLAITPHKYWRATIDGHPAQLHVANIGFQGLVIERGRHHLEMRYRNTLVVMCAWISAITAFVLVVLIPVQAVLRGRPRDDSENRG